MGRPEFHRLADRELNEAAQYFDLENPGLGSSFLKEVDRCLRSIEDHPEAGVIFRGSVRRRLLRRFPYALLYKIRPSSIRILAVMNLKRRPTYWVADIPEAKPVLDDRGKAFAPIVAAVKAGDAVQATKLFFDWVNNQGAGVFDKQPEDARQMFLDNARTVPLLLAAPPPPAISCTTLSGVKAPTSVVGGEQTRRYFSLINEVVVRCIPGSRLIIIPKATHAMSYQNPAAFNEALLHFLAQQ